MNGQEVGEEEKGVAAREEFDEDIVKMCKGEIAQIDSPYFSSIAFEKFLKERACFRGGTEVMDIGTGLGANLHYFREQNPTVRFLGIDYNPTKVEVGRRFLEKKGLEGIRLEAGDWFRLPSEYKGRFDGILSIHIVCCFKRIDPALEALTALKPRWLAINSLFYQGPLDVLIHIRNHNNPELKDDDPDGDFNIFSLEHTARVLAENGYKLSSAEPFYPPVSLPKKPGGGRGTYTMRTDIHERTQFSGPVHLPWHFLLAMKKE
jgi:SAM-dependent methyltransferase